MVCLFKAFAHFDLSFNLKMTENEYPSQALTLPTKCKFR